MATGPVRRRGSLVTPGVEPFVLAGLPVPVVAVTATGRQAGRCRTPCAISAVQSVSSVVGDLAPRALAPPPTFFRGRRMAVIGDVTAGDLPDVLLVPIRALMRPFAADLAEERPWCSYRATNRVSTRSSSRWSGAGYERVPMVERRGQFAVRGGLLWTSSCPPTRTSHPDGSSSATKWINCARSQSPRSAHVGRERNAVTGPGLPGTAPDAPGREARPGSAAEVPHIADVLGDLADGTPVEGMESLAPVLAERMVTLLDLLPAGTPLINIGRERIQPAPSTWCTRRSSCRPVGTTRLRATRCPGPQSGGVPQPGALAQQADERGDPG